MGEKISVTGQVLIQRTAQSHVKHLYASAYAEQRLFELCCLAGYVEILVVTLGYDASTFSPVSLSKDLGIYVISTTEQHPVKGLEHLVKILLFVIYGEQERDAACLHDCPDIVVGDIMIHEGHVAPILKNIVMIIVAGYVYDWFVHVLIFLSI